MQAMREAIDQIDIQGNQLLLLEHQDTITYTRQHGTKHLLLNPDEIAKRGIELIQTDRGGDITFHGTGQLVGYPVIKLSPKVGVVDYLRALEAALIKACHELGIKKAGILEGKTGIWVENHKLIAIGVGLSRQITRHGFALNISTNLERFLDCITPCGLTGFGVTSLERELNTPQSFEKAKEVLTWHLQSIC